MPPGESIVSIALGGSFFCLATDRNLLRIHSFSGKACQWVLEKLMVEHKNGLVLFMYGHGLYSLIGQWYSITCPLPCRPAIGAAGAARPDRQRCGPGPPAGGGVPRELAR